MNRLLVTCSLLSLVLAAQSAHASSFRDAYLHDQSIRAGRPSPGKVKSAFQTIGEQHKAGTVNLFGKNTPTTAAPSTPAKAAPKPKAAPTTPSTPPPPKAPPPPAAPTAPKPSVALPKTGGNGSAPPASPSILDQIQGSEARRVLRTTPAPVERRGTSFLDEIVQNPKGNLRGEQEAKARADAIAARNAPRLANVMDDPDKTNYLPRGATAEEHYTLLKDNISSSSVPNQYSFQNLSPIELSLLSLYDMAYGDGSISEAIEERFNRSVTGEPIKTTVKSGRTGIDALDRIRDAVAADDDDDEGTAPSMLAEESARPLNDEMSALVKNIERFEYLWKRFLSEKTATEVSSYFTPKDDEALKATLIKLRDKLTAKSPAELDEKRLAMSRIDEEIARLQEPKRPISENSDDTVTRTSESLRAAIRAWGQRNGFNLLKLQKILTAATNMTFSLETTSEEQVEQQLRDAARNSSLNDDQINDLIRTLKTKSTRETRITTYPLVETETTKTKWVRGKKTTVTERVLSAQTNTNTEGFSAIEKMALALDQERPYQKSLALYNVEIDTLRKERRNLELRLRSLDRAREAIMSPLNAVIGSFGEAAAEESPVDTPPSDKPPSALDAWGKAFERFKLNTGNSSSTDGREGVDENEWSDDEWGSEDWD